MPESGKAASRPPVTGETHLYPLKDFYVHADLPLPRIEAVEIEQLPEPCRKLLVQTKAMASVLQEFHHDNLHLEIIKDEKRGPFHHRQYILRRDANESPVEFGANKIHLACLPEDAQALVLENYLPLGRILKECGVAHRVETKAFLRVESDATMNQAFELDQSATLYGRKSWINDSRGRPLSEIVEILPPIHLSNPRP